MFLKTFVFALSVFSLSTYAEGSAPLEICAASLEHVSQLSTEQKRVLTEANAAAFSVSVFSKLVEGREKTIVLVGELNRKSFESAARFKQIISQFTRHLSEDRDFDRYLRPYWFARALKKYWPQSNIMARTFLGPDHHWARTILPSRALDAEADDIADSIVEGSREAIERGESTFARERAYILSLNDRNTPLEFVTRALVARLSLPQVVHRLEVALGRQDLHLELEANPEIDTAYVNLAQGYKPSLRAKIYSALWLMSHRLPSSFTSAAITFSLASAAAIAAPFLSQPYESLSLGLSFGLAGVITATQYGKVYGFNRGFFNSPDRSEYLARAMASQLENDSEHDQVVAFVRVLQVKEVSAALQGNGFKLEAELPFDMAQLGVPKMTDLEKIRAHGIHY